jgi:dienelactone hydrolase
MNRRQFLHSANIAANLAATAAGSTALLGVSALAAERTPHGPPVMRRFNEQRWALDNIIQANGIDWDQGRTSTLLRACGLDILGDMTGLRQRVRKYADITPAFEALARRRENLAKEHEQAGERIPARDNYYFAAQYWAMAMWPIDEVDDKLKTLDAKKRETFSKYIGLADRKVEWVEIPYRGGKLPAVLTLPPGYQPGSRIPIVVAVPGMDGYKERFVGLRGDPWTERGVAVLCVEGPGYWESPVRGIFVDVAGWAETGKEVMKWILARPEFDPERIGVLGTSFGSFFAAILISDEPRYKACAIVGTCYEPGGHAIFEEASPTFKRRFMFMSGITDEREFDEFRKTLDWHGYAEKIKVPFLVIAGEADELCPLPNTDAFVKALGGPKQFVVYQDARHSIGGVPAATNGPETRTLQAEWMMARLAGKPLKNERWFVEASGRVNKAALV